MSVLIARAQGADAATANSLDQSIFAAAAYPAEQWVREMQSRQVHVFLAFDSGSGRHRAVGFILTGVSGDDLEIHKIGVLPEFRRQGIAEALVMHAAYAAMDEKADLRVIIEVSAANLEAQQFYQKLQFQELARRKKYYKDGSDAIVMERTIHQR